MAIFTRSAFAAMMLLALAACDSAEERAEKHFESGIELLQAGDVSRAMVEFRNVLSLNESHRGARVEYARQARIAGNISESYSNYLRLAEQFPDDLEARLALSEMAILHLNWEEAERHGAALIQANSEIKGQDTVELALEFRKAVVDKDSARMRELTREAEKIFAENPVDPIIHRILIEGYTAENQFDKAIEVTDKALAEAPDTPLYYKVKTRILASAGENDALLAHLRETVDRFPDDDASKADLIRLLVSQGDSRGAEDLLRAEIEASDDKVVAHISLITFIQGLRGPEAALEEIEIALGLYEDVRLLQALKAGLVFDMGRREEGVALMQGVVDASEPSDETDRFKITLAKMLEATGNEVGARQLVEAVLERDTGQVEALKMSASWLIASDQADEAIITLRRALDQEPEDAEAMTLMANAHDRNGDQQLAQDLLAMAVEASNNAVPESLRFVQVLMNQQRFSSAEEVLVNALRRDPGNLALLTRLGDVYLRTEDWSRALQVEATLRRQETEQATLAADDLQLQIISNREGNEKAFEYLEKLAGTDRGGLSAKTKLVLAHLAEGENAKALALAEELVKQFPDNPKLKLVLGNTYLAMQNLEDANVTFRDVLDKEDDSVAAIQLIRTLGAQGKTDEVQVVIAEMLERMPENPDLLWAQASFLERNQDIDGAIAIYERLYALNSNSPVVANNLASLLATYKLDDESLDRAFVVGRRLRGTDVAPFQDTYGWILYRRGDFDQALTYLEPAANALSGDPIVIYHLAKTYAALGRDEDAIAAFQAALDVAGPSDARSQFEDAKSELERLSTKSE